jgi:lysozyme family protein
MRWFRSPDPSKAKGDAMVRANFETALSAVLAHEGGYVDHPDDPGGATNMGVTHATLADWRGALVTRAEVRALTRAEAAAIYEARYWHAVRADELPGGLDLALFDFAVNSGPVRAIRSLQAVLGVAVDGRIGPITLAAIAVRDASALVGAMSAARLAFLTRLSTFPVFGRGWTRRVEAVRTAALKLAAAPPAKPLNPQETDMDLTKTFLASRTIWANLVGFFALALSFMGFDTAGLDKSALTENLLQAIAAVSFIASTLFRVLASRRIG